MELKDRIVGLVRALPPAQRVGIIAAVLVLVMAAVPFARWITSPSYSVLYAGLEDAEIAEVTTELEGRGVPYELDGSRVLVPQAQVDQARVDLAQVGLSGSTTVPGYELLDGQALGVSDFRQRVDLQRAVEGELARTLGSMDSLESATVRLVLPEESLFTEQRTPATASVLVRPTRDLDAGQIEAITLLVASSVEGLETDQITVADTDGRVLHAPGDGSTGGVTDRQQRRTNEFEQALSADLTRLLQEATGAPSSVVVRADLDFDETEIHTEAFDDEAIALRESTTEERYEGAGVAPGGTVGVDGGPLLGTGGEGNYERDEATREFGVGRTVTRVVQAPGAVEDLSVALVVSEGSPIPDGDLRDLVGAAAGIGPDARADAIAISRVVTPPAPEELPEGGGLLDHLPEIIALLVLVLVALGLFLMSRRRRDSDTALAPVEKVVPASVRTVTELPEVEQEPELPKGPTVQEEVAALVERQPEEIASLLRGWLADRRTNA